MLLQDTGLQISLPKRKLFLIKTHTKNSKRSIIDGSFEHPNILVREPAIPLIKWLRPKGLRVCSYVEKYAEFKNQTLKKNRLVHKNAMRNRIPWGYAISQISTEMGYPIPNNLI